MRKANKFWILAAAILLVAPAHTVLAGSSAEASKHFFDNSGGGGGQMNFRLKITTGQKGDLKDVSTSPGHTVTVGDPEAAAPLAIDSSINLCEAARDAGYQCDGVLPYCDGSVGDCCDTANNQNPNNLMDVSCQTSASGLPQGKAGFEIYRNAAPNNTAFQVFASAGAQIKALDHNTTAGNRVDTDLNSRFCVRIDRGSPQVDGTVNFYVRHFHGNGPPVNSTFSVDTTGKSDTAIHQEVVDNLTGLGLGLGLGVAANPGMNCEFTETFNGPLAAIWRLPGAGVLEFGVDGVQGQNIVAETNGVAQAGSIPTLNEWGLLLLVLLLGASAVWMLYHRRKLGGEA
ncbi:MAG TPA: IPTL-CTERM sorting domain-containing protein [Candidatus Saccharimonadales bacterium]|nr:IPTL-CTERM sorting domain-containing protein [Candidatus Saccharimonadales bacterium]